MTNPQRSAPELSSSHRAIPDPLEAILNQEAKRLEHREKEAPSDRERPDLSTELADLKRAVHAVRREKP